MRSFEIFVDKPANTFTRDDDHRAPTSGTRSRRPDAQGAREVLDIFIEGANATARVAESQAFCVLRDLAFAAVELARRPRGKAIVRFYDEAWELCVERLGTHALLSVYRAGGDPSVAVHDREVAFADVVESAREAIDFALNKGDSPASLRLDLETASNMLRAIDAASLVAAPPAAPLPTSVEIDRDAPIALACDFVMREAEASDLEAAETGIERADLHALLFRGRLRAEIRGRAVDLGEGHPFLVAERLLAMSRDALDAWERGQALNVRAEAGSLIVGVRVGTDGALALTLGGARSSGGAMYTFPALGVTDVVEAALGFGRALVRAILRRDRTQCTNLRMSAFRRQLRETSDALREVCRSDAKINPTPEPYRAFAQSVRSPGRETPAPRPIEPPHAPITPATRLRYAARWRALVPGIDLKSTFLCGDRIVVGAAAETFCLDRESGEVLWRVPSTRATSVVTPGGIARLHADGSLAVHDYGNGEVTLRTWLAPRLGGPAAGAVVHVPGLPRLLVVTEGERHLVAIDLTSGEARWRFAWGSSRQNHLGTSKRGALRMKRGGKLLYFTSGDSALTALDVLTGAVVWRVRDRLRFRSSPTLDHDLLFAIAGGMSCATTLHAIDPFSGHIRWSRAITVEGANGASVEGAPLVTGNTVAVTVRDRKGLRLFAFDRENGNERFCSEATVAPVGTSWLAVDDLFIGNAPTGDLVAIDSTAGETRYRHVLGRALDVDTPRRLEPILRSGALFVPHTDVHVFRPHDGAKVGAISPCDAIPDLLRVDERCNVYVAEESGHLVCFGAAPRLSLVR